MRSYEEQRQQNISPESLRQREAVKPPGYAGAPSSLSAQVAPSSREAKNNLLERMLEGDNLRLAYKRVVENGGAPGVDQVTVANLQAYLKTHWESAKAKLLAGTYRPAPVKRVEIPKPGGDVRLLGIPTVMDRFLQQALLQVMNPIFDTQFSWYSYGFRPGKSAHDAVKQAQRYIQSGLRWVVDLDLEKFFDRVNHDILMARVARKVEDKRVLTLIRAYLNAGVMVDGKLERSREGTPQGGPLSPLLANILLDDLDKELMERGLRFVRYADDCNIFVASKRAGERVMESVTRFVEGKLKLKVNREKSAVDRPWNRKFLGFSFLRDKKATICLAPQTISRFKEKVRELTSRTRSMSMENRIMQLNRYLIGWIGYFRIASAKSHCERFDQWIRRRLRMCLWKQWKRVGTRIRELRNLGVPEWACFAMGNSRRGAWEMSRNTNNALPTSYWEAKGLKSLLSRYLELC
ncbi:group II intron reverse transcriptase/maturase [Paenibacillus yonginensis]|uniref:RNA-directed DNA polymerase n=1 Tax=Paenibacillus yonginensis TaxID=1462996 RepID=A0A1B1N1E1_9BACL|nr:group II intron reverse transcriptase/maturase [Paenibacillus yonginensis]ANS73224.1 group II intron reverse transcriptase/maturase [Paenibacillus yonginensis]ANS75226.1 group II intron reverse transcriptase/maturase [Paenibacillus yonginensis]ANS75963.1 group II intron reverse transcriptase/maturase [Paenibacillus yonginensis]ANS76811.1 group II intron reverse transcriptase/maturase [Paenibacillus yonginensis]